MSESPDSKMVLELLLEKKKRLQSRTDLKVFSNYILGMELARHHLLICNELEMIVSGENDRLLIAAPPGSAKTTYVNRLFPAYYLGRKPNNLVITASHTADLAEDNSAKVRNIIESRKYKNVFPETQISRDSRSKGKWTTTTSGEYFSIGVGGAVAGRRSDLTIIDDPFKTRADAHSKTTREKVKAWYREDIYTRNKAGGAIVLIATRWHEDDLSGELIAKDIAGEGDKWRKVIIPAICENSLEDPLGRKIGESYWPENFPREKLLDIKRLQTVSGWESLYQQNPTPLESGMMTKSWFRWYPPEKVPSPIVKITQSWDTASSKEDRANPSVCTTWAQVGFDHYLLHVFRDRLEYPDLLKKVIELAARYSPNAVLIENKGSGQQLCQSLKGTRYPVIPINPEAQGNKIFRFDSVTPMFTAGQVFLPGKSEQHEKWVEEYIFELMTFPNNKNDDQVDSTSQYLSWASPRSRRGMMRIRG